MLASLRGEDSIAELCRREGLHQNLYYRSTVLDDYLRYILAWRLYQDHERPGGGRYAVKVAVQTVGLTKKQRPKLLSDTSPCYLSAELQDWLGAFGLTHIRGKPYHPMTQGKIEWWHSSLKNRNLLEHYYLPGKLEQQIEVADLPEDQHSIPVPSP